MDIYAIKAEISTKDPPISCEDTGATFRAASAAWVNISEAPSVWMQMGWAKERKLGATNDTRFVYCELNWGNPTSQVWEIMPLQGTASHTYEINLDRSTGNVVFKFDGNAVTLNPPIPQAAKDRFKLFSGVSARWAGEIIDLKSRIPGTNNATCDFLNCQYKEGIGTSWQSSGIVKWLEPTNATNYDSTVGGNTVKIWDKR